MVVLYYMFYILLLFLFYIYNLLFVRLQIFVVFCNVQNFFRFFVGKKSSFLKFEDGEQCIVVFMLIVVVGLIYVMYILCICNVNLKIQKKVSLCRNEENSVFYIIVDFYFFLLFKCLIQIIVILIVNIGQFFIWGFCIIL